MIQNALVDQLFSEIKIRGNSTGQQFFEGADAPLEIVSPTNGELVGMVKKASTKQYFETVKTAQQAFSIWRNWPAPKRGEIVRQFGNKLRDHKQALGELVSYEMGKSLQEGLGEVQEMIDICDFAVGLSRQLYGLQIASERPQHRMMEQWHPLGIVGIISAFNFPVAVWSWNAAIAWVCGDVCLWKPSEKTPFSAIACQKIWAEVAAENNLPEGISNLILGDREIGEIMAGDTRIPLISATGSTRMGKAVAETVGRRLGKTILELGGNNALIVSASADIKQAIPAVVFGAVGTAGQRCTSTRRLFVHKDIYAEFMQLLVNAYKQLKIGDPLDQNNHVGPLIDQEAVKNYTLAIAQAKQEGGKVLVGDKVLQGCYVQPTIIESEAPLHIAYNETFAPILYVNKYDRLDEAIRLQNAVPQGLSSAIFTLNVREAEQFLSASGSDCGIANVNIGTSGAEIGGAFGGEKETGGGRESGSDAWKAYMRRQTNTVNYGTSLPLAQGIKFEL